MLIIIIWSRGTGHNPYLIFVLGAVDLKIELRKILNGGN
jgi:hypothetical protein